MKLYIEKLIPLFLIAVLLLWGCAGCGQKTAIKGIEPQDDFNEQSKYGPVAANTREPVELPLFPEPSFENLIEQFKADVAANRGDPEVLKRKKLVINNPDRLWKEGSWGPRLVVPRFALTDPDPKGNPSKPDDILILGTSQKGKTIVIEEDEMGKPKYTFAGKVFYITDEQVKRIKAIRDILPEDQWERRRYEVMLEKINSFTAARYLLSQGARVAETIGIEYAERAMQDYPNSVEAMHIWVNCHSPDQRLPAYKAMLTKFPNYSEGHEIIAHHYVYTLKKPELAIEHVQKAMLLNNRLEGQLLGRCYLMLGEWEKAIAIYQSLSEINGFEESFLSEAQRKYEDEQNKR